MTEGLSKQKTKTSVISIAHIISTYLCLFIIILYLYIWVQPASHHLYTNLHIKLRRIAHLLQNISHHLHILIPVKAPAHERVIYNENIVGNGAHDVPPLSNVIYHTAILHFSLFTIHLFMRTVGDAGPYIPCDMSYHITLLRNK